MRDEKAVRPRLVIPTGNYGEQHEYTFVNGELHHRLVPESGGRFDADRSTLKLAAPDQALYLIHHAPKELRALCEQSGIEFQKLKESYGVNAG
jgi:hypothetical protein